MRRFLVIVALAGLMACNSNGEVKQSLDSLGKEADSLVKKVEDSKVMDSIKSKGGKLLDSVKSKGGKLVDKAEEKFSDLKTKDTTK